MTIVEASRRLRAREIRAVDLVEDSLAAIGQWQPRTNAFTRVDAEGALRAAAQADRELADGADRGPLHGIPVTLKDLIDQAGIVTTAGSRVLADRVAPADATVVSRLRDAGAVIIGRTNLHEFALGTTCEDSAFGPVRHPRDSARSAGGSSGGSAVAVACGMGLASIGTDTGGSVRIPAAACGIVGLKPSHDDVPTDGVIPLSASFDHVGPLALSVDDAAAIWAVIAGRPMPDLRRASPIRLGRIGGDFDVLEPGVREAYERAIAALERSGVVITPAGLPASSDILEAYVNIVLPEGAAWHARYLDTRGADYTPTVRARFESGRAIPEVKRVEAQRFCLTLRSHVDELLEHCDALVLPTLPITAPLLGADEITIDAASGARANVRAAMLKHTQPFNMTGHPAISVPLRTPGLPVGLQIAGRRDDTAGLLAIAAACEKIVADA